MLGSKAKYRHTIAVGLSALLVGPLLFAALVAGSDTTTRFVGTGIALVFGCLVHHMILSITQSEGYPEKKRWYLRRLPRQFIRIAEIASFQRTTHSDIERVVQQWTREFSRR